MNELSGFVLLNNAGTDVWLKKSKTCSYYSMENDKVTAATVNDLIGKTVYVATYDGMAQMFIAVER